MIRKTRPKRIALLSVMTVLMGGAAIAQSGPNAVVDAVASPVITQPPLALTAVQSLSFGTVNIPNGTETGHKCAYETRIVSTVLYELDENGSAVTASTPNASGCDWGNTGTPDIQNGLVSVVCNSASVVDFAGEWITGAATGIELKRPNSAGLRAYQSGTETAIANGAMNGTLRATCPVSGEMDIAVGGRIEMTDEVVASANISVGTITLDATY